MTAFLSHSLAFFAVVLSATGAFPKELPVLLSSDEVVAARRDLRNDRRAFDLVGTVRSFVRRPTEEWTVSLLCGTNELVFFEQNTPERSAVDPGRFGLLDRIRIRGYLYHYKAEIPTLDIGYHTAELLEPGDITHLPLTTPSEIENPTNINRILRIRGIVRDAARDDSDPDYIHLDLRDGTGTAQVMVWQPAFLPTEFGHLLGADVIATGICSDNGGLRQHVGRLLIVSSLANVAVAKPAASFGDAPPLESLSHTLPSHFAAAGHHQASGTVLAAWDGDNLLMRTASGRLVRVRLQDGRLPRSGVGIRVLGLPTTDFYNLNLIHARWEAEDIARFPFGEPESVSAKSLLTNEQGHPQLKVSKYGSLIRLTGLVRYVPEDGSGKSVLQIETDGVLVAVNVSTLPELLSKVSVGCRISVTGICVMNADGWHRDSSEWQPTGLFLVPRTVDDIVVLSRPSWWTPERLLALLGIFAAALLGVIGWNVSLNRRAHRKGKELAAEQLAHVTSELKVNERTRLAVELHDALSQTLTGVSMQIDTAAGAAEGNMPTVTKCLNLASRTIDACRMELRNTLWDLRSAALDEPSMDAAIRKTLCQNLAGIDLSVRFNVPRETFSDNTAHVILKIIRELATNALRHGKATSLRIAGTIEGDKLLFSVKDNGCGFDPDLAPGIAQGHFGLQGVAERLERLNGEMTINSTPGKGTKVTVTWTASRF